jgi:hypothetical protein
MASVIGCVLGGDPVRLEASTVAEVKELLELEGNYTVLVDGETANLTDKLKKENFVSFTPAVKGGNV